MVVLALLNNVFGKMYIKMNQYITSGDIDKVRELQIISQEFVELLL